MTIAELRNNLGGPSAEYRAKQLHAVPKCGVKDRETFILARCEGKVVLDIGASGPMHEAIVGAAKQCWGLDHPRSEAAMRGGSAVVAVTSDAQPAYVVSDKSTVQFVDLDDMDARMPQYPLVDVIVCGEVIEHLSNPGWFLDKLRSTYPGVPVIITVPNAFCEAGWKSLQQGIENVNREHVAYYSYHTLKELVTRHGYMVKEHYWYKGRPMFSEGLIFVVE